ncbi:hypothetical protein BC332_03619 [Capsicum chinense]|nr:hypothetical protein BC332_03619 [Capsicum chinense]
MAFFVFLFLNKVFRRFPLNYSSGPTMTIMGSGIPILWALKISEVYTFFSMPVELLSFIREVDRAILKRLSSVLGFHKAVSGYENAFLLFSFSRSSSLFERCELIPAFAIPAHLVPQNRLCSASSPLSEDCLVWKVDSELQSMGGIPLSKYRILLDKLGVTISEAKSIISETGCVEFAKRFWVKSMQIDLSPVSLRLLLSCRTTIGLCSIRNKYPAACCKPNRSHPLPLEWWIGRFGNLNPYLKGKIVDYLRRELKPKEIDLFPEEMVFDKKRDILEHTVILNWVVLNVNAQNRDYNCWVTYALLEQRDMEDWMNGG